MSIFKRAALLVGSAVLFGLAAALVLNAGLPERAAFTGLISPNGEWTAPELHALAPSFNLSTLTGDAIALEELRGAPVIINFWATWCEPCRIEMPELERLYTAQRQNGLRILAVNLDESVDSVRRWVQTLGLTFDILLDEKQRVAGLYQLRGQPVTYVVAPDGVIAAVFYGATSADTLQTALSPYLST